jgi:uracil-DNA glycosylase
MPGAERASRQASTVMSNTKCMRTPAQIPGFLEPADLGPRALQHADARLRRRALLDSRPLHMTDLIDHVANLRRQRPQWKVPDFDPACGGVEARALFLLEKPGPMTAVSGFISIHNNDQTAAAVHGFLLTRNLPVRWCLFANVIPWWDGTRKISPEQRRLSTDAIKDLLKLLPDLRAIVLLGGTAQRAWKRIGLPTPAGVKLWESAHPSPLVRARYRARWEAIPTFWPDRQALEVPQRDPRRLT